MTRYRHAIWPPSEKWRNGYQYGAPIELFKMVFASKVHELGAPLRVWDSDSERFAEAEERLAEA